MEAMKSSQLAIANSGYKTAEEAIYIQDSCWALLITLWKLNLLHYPDDDEDSEEAYFHHKSLVEMWYQLYMERKGS